MDKLEIATIGALRELEIPQHILGHSYIKSAIKRVTTNPKLMQRITTELYPSIASEFNSSPSKVERAIRHAISLGTQDKDTRKRILGSRCDLSNSHFIAAAVEYLTIQFSVQKMVG